MTIEAQAAFILSLLGPQGTPRLQKCVASCSPQADSVQHLGAFALLRPKRRHAQKSLRTRPSKIGQIS